MGTEHSVSKHHPPPSTPTDQKYHPKTSLQHAVNNFPSENTESTKPSAGSLTFKRRKSSRSLSAIVKPQKQMKTVFIRLENGSQAKVSFDIAQQDKLTCEWLVSEAISQLAQDNLLKLDPRRPIVALQTLDHLIPLDYWLSCPGKSISVLKDGMVLTPFYGDNNYKIQGQKVNLSFFHIVKMIGSGGFSKVYLIRRKDNGNFYALKVIVKEGMSDQELKALANEREVFVRVNHPFLAKLHFAFQTTGQLFLIMDFFPGGELYYNLQQKKKITEAQAKIYVGEIILALSYLHKNKILYRDLKPENLLLDIDGHLNLTDFGLCKQVRNRTDLNYTFCGSPEYLAPEVINESGYNFSVDFYGLGVLIYEMVIGETPFSVKNKNQDLFTKILANKIKFPKGISSDLKSFISSLMKGDPKQRLGARNGFIEIINHPWCRDIDFFEIATKKTKAPIVPDLYKMNFAEYYLDKEITLEEENSISLNTEPAEHFHIEGYLMVDSLAREIHENLFRNFSFYDNVENCEKYTDSVFVLKDENSPGLPKKNPVTEEDEFQGRNEMMMKPEFKVKSGKTPKVNTLPKIHLNEFEDCQENYIDDDENEEVIDVLKQPLSLKKIPSTTTQRLQTLDRTGTSPFINYVQTQTSILTPGPFTSKQRTFDFDLTIKKVKSHDVRPQELSLKFGSGLGSGFGSETAQVPKSLVKKSTLPLNAGTGHTTTLSTNLMEDSSSKYPKSGQLHFDDTDSGSPLNKVPSLKKQSASTFK